MKCTFSNTKRSKDGAFADFIATLLISLAIALSELAYIMPMRTFYSIIIISLGSTHVIDTLYLVFEIHLIIGSLIGIVLGDFGIRWVKSAYPSHIRVRFYVWELA